ncbi:hypothetical protein J2T57_001639 [Natronocella acetinitrilica]|uniref:Uncharacterized protein n=1 Tax=Natronocella acetinitrilica TaxID=414046 RepID=A0AAE3G335_9GAMM|nr:hypothetical protein [Natronocella acetinitrilica]MCP1674537.1 hypothetical protein [Natronocella acetinitrilica]
MASIEALRERTHHHPGIERGKALARLTHAARVMLAGTKATHPDGLPVIAYRGEHGASGAWLETRLPSISFGSREAAGVYACQPNNRNDRVGAARVLPAFLSIKNPIMNDPDDPYLDLVLVRRALGQAATIEIALRHAEHIIDTGNWLENFDSAFGSVEELLALRPQAIDELYLDAYVVLDDGEAVRALAAVGCDGAIHGGNGVTALDTEYRVFDSRQVISVLTGRPVLAANIEQGAERRFAQPEAAPAP